jgi:hypothetical protein
VTKEETDPVQRLRRVAIRLEEGAARPILLSLLQ